MNLQCKVIFPSQPYKRRFLQLQRGKTNLFIAASAISAALHLNTQLQIAPVCKCVPQCPLLWNKSLQCWQAITCVINQIVLWAAHGTRPQRASTERDGCIRAKIAHFKMISNLDLKKTTIIPSVPKLLHSWFNKKKKKHKSNSYFWFHLTWRKSMFCTI